MLATERIKKGQEKDWEKIDVQIHTAQFSVRGGGICYPAFYQGIKIARLFCAGLVDFINKEKWKKGWEFKFDWKGDEKFFYRYVGK